MDRACWTGSVWPAGATALLTNGAVARRSPDVFGKGRDHGLLGISGRITKGCVW